MSADTEQKPEQRVTLPASNKPWLVRTKGGMFIFSNPDHPDQILRAEPGKVLKIEAPEL